MWIKFITFSENFDSNFFESQLVGFLKEKWDPYEFTKSQKFWTSLGLLWYAPLSRFPMVFDCYTTMEELHYEEQMVDPTLILLQLR